MSNIFKSKAKKTDTGQDLTASTKPPTIQVDKAPPGLPHKESFSHKTKEKVQGFFSHLRPSRSRASSPTPSERMKSQEYLPVRDTNTNPKSGKDGGSVGKTDDTGGGIKFVGETSPEPIGQEGKTGGSVAEVKAIDKATVEMAIKDAKEHVQTMDVLGDVVQTGASFGAQASTALADADAVSNLLQPLKIFDSVVKGLSDLHPYAAIALSVLSWASQVIIAQANRDKSILDLQSKISDIYRFMIEDGQLNKIISMKDVLSQTSQVMLECAKFIKVYSQPSFLSRLGKGIFSSTDDVIGMYNKALDGLMQQFHRNATRDILITTHDVLANTHDALATTRDVLATTHDIQEDVRSASEYLKQLGDNQYINRIAYAEAAGLDTTKSCLEGTREEILHEVVDWINNADINAPRMLWLSGPAGTGKSAIAQTIALAMKGAGALGSCFCFEKGDVKRYTKLFATISRDLANHDLMLKQAVARTVADDPSIGTTADIKQQWDKLIMEPISVVANDIVGRLVIVIDALDESGDDESRKHILATLAKKAIALPENIRILLTSRPLPDIGRALGSASHVVHKSMDEISLSSTERDIQSYISSQLSDIDDTFSADEIAELAKRSDGLFEYARLACNYIQSTRAGLSPKERFDDLMSRTEKGGNELLDDMYKVILKTIMGEIPDERVLIRFRSVMRHVLFTLEPLPLDALLTMHRSNQTGRGQYNAELTILRPMASLLSGIYDRSVPIRPLHSSFHDFLIDQERSGIFFVNAANAHLDLALASLSVMQQELQFNICRLESSYMRNSEIDDLPQRIKQYISPQLSYSCRFLANHVEGIVFDIRVADMLRAFFGNERILFWIETLGVLHSISILPGSLSIILIWLENKAGYETTAALVKDSIQLVRNFGSVISESTSHLYISVLPFLPQSSILSQHFSSKFPSTAKLTSGQLTSWPPVEFVLGGHTDTVSFVVFSPDGKYVASASYDDTIRVWDAEVGLLVGSPLKGHTDSINSVAFSPDGRQIVSGSDDGSIRIWDIMAGSLVRDPIENDTGEVNAVVFSPDGKRLVSGSEDNAISIWDVGTGQRIDKPFEGHSDDVLTVAFSPDGQRIVSGSDDATICVWDAMTGLQVLKPLEGHSDSVWSVAFSLDGKRIVSGSSDTTICIWDAETGSQLSSLTGHVRSVYSVFFSPDGKWILSGSDDGIRLWDIDAGNSKPLTTVSDGITAVSISADGKKLVSGSTDHSVYIGDIGIMEVENLQRGHNDGITSVAFSPDGKQIVSSSYDSNICIWDAETGALIKGPLKYHSALVWSVVFSPDGERIASGSADQTICILDAKTGLQLGDPLRGHEDEVYMIAFSPDNQKIVSCSDDKTICIWDVNTGSKVGESINAHSEAVLCVAFSPDGERIVSGSEDKTICIWDAKTRMQIGSPLTGHTDSVCSVVYSPDGGKIVSCSDDRTICIWDAITGLQVGTSLTGHTDGVKLVAFSPDGQKIMSGSIDQTVRIWDPETGMEVGSPFRGHTGTIPEVAFSANGRHIVSCSVDVTIRVWELVLDTKIYEHVNLSSKAEYSLCDAVELFDGTTASVQKWKEFMYLNTEGWMIGPEGRLLLWIPVQYRKLLHMPGTLIVLPDPAIELDLSMMAHGKRWMKCFDGGCLQ